MRKQKESTHAFQVAGPTTQSCDGRCLLLGEVDVNPSILELLSHK